MSLRHSIFARCADLETDGYLQEMYMHGELPCNIMIGRFPLPSLAYGMYPFCVSEDTNTQSLIFRRSIGVGEKDKAQRLADAADALKSFPAVVSYNATIGMANAAPLHVQPGAFFHRKHPSTSGHTGHILVHKQA